jgi:hypothetical protein
MTAENFETDDGHKKPHSLHLIHIVYIKKRKQIPPYHRPLLAPKMVKIALLGAAGQIGTPLSLLCKAVSPSP